MTKRQAESEWREFYLPHFNRQDKPMLRESWNNFTDGLLKEGRISEQQYNNWSQPREAR